MERFVQQITFRSSFILRTNKFSCKEKSFRNPSFKFIFIEKYQSEYKSLFHNSIRYL